MFPNANLGHFVATAFFAFVAGIVFSVWYAARARRQLPKPHKLAGATIPELAEFLDLEKYYDILYEVYRSEPTTIHAVRIIGYIGSDLDEASKFYIRGRWLVVAFRDGRKVYLSPESIMSLTESTGA